MTRQQQREQDAALSRRTLVQGLALGAAATMAGTGTALAQTGPAAPPTTTTNPPRDFGPNGAPSTYFSDPDVFTVDPSFGDITQANTTIQRIWHGDINGNRRCGWRAPPGTAKVATPCAATFRTIARSAGWKTTGTSASCASRQTIATATHSTIKAARSPASI